MKYELSIIVTTKTWTLWFTWSGLGEDVTWTDAADADASDRKNDRN